MTTNQTDLRTALAAKAEEQVAYWRERQAAEKSPDDGISEDGETYTPIGDVAAWQGGYCNGRMSEADWWRQTLLHLPPVAGDNILRSALKAIADGKTVVFDEAEQCDVETWLDEEDLQRIARDALTPAQAPGKAGEREGVEDDARDAQYKAEQAEEAECDALFRAETAEAEITRLQAIIAALTPQPAGTEASRGVGAEDWRTKAADEVEGIAGLWEGDGRSYAMTIAAILRAEEPNELPPANDETKRVVARAWGRFQRGVAARKTDANQDTHRRFMEPLADWARSLDGRPVSTADLARLVTICAATPTPPLSPDSTGPAGASSQDFEQHFLTIEKRLCAILGRPWAPTGFSIETLLDDLAALTPSAPIAAAVWDDGALSFADEAQMALCHLDWIASPPGAPHPHRIGVIRRALERLASLPAPAGDVPGEAQTQEGER
jgi:hypothetical protein